MSLIPEFQRCQQESPRRGGDVIPVSLVMCAEHPVASVTEPRLYLYYQSVIKEVFRSSFMDMNIVTQSKKM